MESTYFALGSKNNFNKALRHFFSVSDVVDDVEAKKNLADVLNAQIDKGEINDDQILPPGSKLFMLPHRSPVGYDEATKSFVTLAGAAAVAAFVAPGYTATHCAAYRESDLYGGLPQCDQ